METEKRLRDVIKTAEPNKGREFAHWFPNGWFVLVRKTKVILLHSHNHDSRTGREILAGPRNAKTYADFATAMGI